MAILPFSKGHGRATFDCPRGSTKWSQTQIHPVMENNFGKPWKKLKYGRPNNNQRSPNGRINLPHECVSVTTKKSSNQGLWNYLTLKLPWNDGNPPLIKHGWCNFPIYRWSSLIFPARDLHLQWISTCHVWPTWTSITTGQTSVRTRLKLFINRHGMVNDKTTMEWTQ